jgi:ribonucleoside-triphosphate reductase
MVPTYFNCDCSINKTSNSELIGTMGCRSRVVNNLYGDNTSIKRGNIACVTINLVQLALESKNNFGVFKENLNEIMEDSKEILIYRFNVLANKRSFKYLKEKNIYLDSEEDDNKKILRNGTLSIGFIGLWDAMAVLLGRKISKDDILGQYHRRGYEIINLMRKKIDKYTKEENLNFSLLASAAEGVSGKFPEYDNVNYSDVIGTIDKEYYTNSFHVPVNIELSCFEKIAAEGAFHKLCNGGAITYIELNEIPIENIEGIKDIVKFAQMQDCSYFGINFPLDICKTCSFTGTINEKCPKCQGKNILKLRRVSGYLADTKKFTLGKYAELKDRKANIFNE